MPSSRGRKPSGFHRFIHSDDINQSISFPNKFILEHQKNILLNNVVVIVSDDKLWSLGWVISGDGKLWLQKGWPEFAEHYCLKIGYLLLFNHHGKSVFHVRIFDQSSCDINYAPLTFQEIQQPATEYDDDDDEDVDDDSLQKVHKLTRVLRKSYRNHLPLNKRFCNAVGIGGYSSLRLRNDEGETWKVKVMKYKSKTTILPHLVTGWPDFRKANDIKVGDISEISHVKGNLLHVHVVKKENRIKVGRLLAKKIDLCKSYYQNKILERCV